MDTINNIRSIKKSIQKVNEENGSQLVGQQMNRFLREEEEKLVQGALGELLYLQKFVTNGQVALFFASIIDILQNPSVPCNSALIRVVIDELVELDEEKTPDIPTDGDAVHELDLFQAIANSPIVKSLLPGLIKILGDPESPANAHLIYYLSLNGHAILGLPNGQLTLDSLSPSMVQIKLPAPIIPDLYAGKYHPHPPEEIYKFSQKMGSSISSIATNFFKKIGRLLWVREYDIWHEDVQWLNYESDVLILLPIDSDVTLDEITCSLLHFDLGHQLEVTYPGAKFSVLINHSNLDGVVKARIVDTKLTIRLTKIRPDIWTYLTLVSATNTSVTFHLSKGHHLTTAKDAQVMKLLHETSLDPEPLSLCPNVKYLDFIDQKFNIDSRSILNGQREFHVGLLNFEGCEFPICFRCHCISCENVASLPHLSPNQAAILPVDLGLSIGPRIRSSGNRNQIRELRIWEVFWMNDVDHVWIYLPIEVDFRNPGMTYDQIRCSLVNGEIGFHLQVRYPGTNFEVSLNHKQIMEVVKVKIQSESIVVRLAKKDHRLYPYLTLLTDEGECLTYHPNANYRLRILNSIYDVAEALEQDFFGDKEPLPSPSHLSIIKRSHDLRASQIFDEARKFHSCPPQPDVGYSRVALRR